MKKIFVVCHIYFGCFLSLELCHFILIHHQMNYLFFGESIFAESLGRIKGTGLDFGFGINDDFFHFFFYFFLLFLLFFIIKFNF